MNVTAADATGAASTIGSFQHAYFLLFIISLIWFIVTVIVMLIMAQKRGSKGSILTVYVGSQLLLLVLLLVGYFNAAALTGWFS